MKNYFICKHDEFMWKRLNQTCVRYSSAVLAPTFILSFFECFAIVLMFPTENELDQAPALVKGFRDSHRSANNTYTPYALCMHLSVRINIASITHQGTRIAL